MDDSFAQTTDPVLWARAFRDRMNPLSDALDEGNLIGWFANAIEVGKREGAAPFGGEGQIMSGYALREALREGRSMQVRYLTGGDISWEDADRNTDDHPDGIPPEWWGHAFGQIDLVVRDVTEEAFTVPGREFTDEEMADMGGEPVAGAFAEPPGVDLLRRVTTAITRGVAVLTAFADEVARDEVYGDGPDDIDAEAEMERSAFDGPTETVVATGGFCAPAGGDGMFSLFDERVIPSTAEALAEMWESMADSCDQTAALVDWKRHPKGSAERQKAKRERDYWRARRNALRQCAKDVRLMATGGGRHPRLPPIESMLPTITVPRGPIKFVAPPAVKPKRDPRAIRCPECCGEGYR